jgi:BolA protein
MTIKNRIEKALQNSLDIHELIVINESDNHAGNNKESHFRVFVVSSDFDNLSLIKRHKLIYKILEEVQKDFYALAIESLCVAEYDKKNAILESPDCTGNNTL